MNGDFLTRCDSGSCCISDGGDGIAQARPGTPASVVRVAKPSHDAAGSPPPPRSILASGRYSERRSSADTSGGTARRSAPSSGPSPTAGDRGSGAAPSSSLPHALPPPPRHEPDASTDRLGEWHGSTRTAGQPPMRGAAAAVTATGGSGVGAEAGGPPSSRGRRSAPGVRGSATPRASGEEGAAGQSLHPSFLQVPGGGGGGGGDTGSVRPAAGRRVSVLSPPSREAPPSGTNAGADAERARLLPHPSSGADLRAPVKVAALGSTHAAVMEAPSSTSPLGSSKEDPSTPRGDASPEDLVYLGWAYRDVTRLLPSAAVTASPGSAGTTMTFVERPDRGAPRTSTTSGRRIPAPPPASADTTPLKPPAADVARRRSTGATASRDVARGGQTTEGPAAASLPRLPAAASPLAQRGTAGRQALDSGSSRGGGAVLDREGRTVAAPSTAAPSAMRRMSSVENLRNYSSFLLSGQHAGDSSAASFSSTASTAGFSQVAPSPRVSTREVDAAGVGGRPLRSRAADSSAASDTTRDMSFSAFSFTGTPAASTTPPTSILRRRPAFRASATASRGTSAVPTPTAAPGSKPPTQTGAPPPLPGPPSRHPVVTIVSAPVLATTAATHGEIHGHPADLSAASLAASSEADWAPGSVMQAVSTEGSESAARRRADDSGDSSSSSSWGNAASTAEGRSCYSGLWSTESRGGSGSSSSRDGTQSDGSWDLDSTKAQRGGVRPAPKVTATNPATAATAATAAATAAAAVVTPLPHRRARRLLPMNSFRSYYIPEALIHEDRSGATYKVRERRTRTRYAATFVLDDDTGLFWTPPGHDADMYAGLLGGTPCSELTAPPAMSAKLKRRCAMALLLDHPNLVPTYDVFYSHDEDAAEVEEIVRCCTGAGGVADATWGPERYAHDRSSASMRPRVAVHFAAAPAPTPMGNGNGEAPSWLRRCDGGPRDVVQHLTRKPSGEPEKIRSSAEVQPPSRSRRAARSVRRWFADLFSSLPTTSPNRSAKGPLGGDGGVEGQPSHKHHHLHRSSSSNDSSDGSGYQDVDAGLDPRTATTNAKHPVSGHRGYTNERNGNAQASAGPHLPPEMAEMMASRERRVAEIRGRCTQEGRFAAARQAKTLETLAMQLFRGRVLAILVSELVEDGGVGSTQKTDARPRTALMEQAQGWRGLPTPLLASVTRGVAAALDYLHTFRAPHLALVHGAVDPRHILVDSRGVVRLVHYDELNWWLCDDPTAGQHTRRQRAAVTAGEDAAASARARRRLCACEGGLPASLLPETATDMYGLGYSLLTLSCGLSLGQARAKFLNGNFSCASETLRGLLTGLMVERPAERLRAAEVLRHPFVTGISAEVLPAGPSPRHRRQQQPQHWVSSKLDSPKLPVVQLPQTAVAVPVSSKAKSSTTTTTAVASRRHGQSAPRPLSPTELDTYSFP